MYSVVITLRNNVSHKLTELSYYYETQTFRYYYRINIENNVERRHVTITLQRDHNYEDATQRPIVE